MGVDGGESLKTLYYSLIFAKIVTKIFENNHYLKSSILEWGGSGMTFSLLGGRKYC